jgi:hypothetical protein
MVVYMNLTRLLSSASRPTLNCTTKVAAFLGSRIPHRTIMGLNGHTNGKQNGTRTKLLPVASRLNEGRALNEDVWSIFK